MNNEEGVKGGEYIKPSARKSIHNHRNCPFLTSEHYLSLMGRYGINNRNRNKEMSVPSQDEGIDEIDNVVSKFAFPIDHSQLIPSKRNRGRRSSIDNDLRNNFSEDDDSNVLSKSLPTTLPSHSYCSDDSTESQDEDQTSRDTGITVRRNISHNNSNEESSIRSFSERESSVLGDSIRRRNQYQAPVKNRIEARKESYRIPIWPFFIIILALPVIAYTHFTTQRNATQHIIYDKNDFYNDVMGLTEKYNVNHESIEKVQSGISSILEKEDADSFMFVYNSASDSFDPEAFNNFMDDIAHFTAKYLRNESASVQHTVIDGGRLTMRDSEQLIDTYSEDVTRTGVLLVREIDAVPSALAMAFHYYCDEYNPVAKKSAIFSTFDLAKCSNGKSSTHATLEKCLENKWKGVPPDNMRPLLSRVVSVVIDVTNGF